LLFAVDCILTVSITYASYSRFLRTYLHSNGIPLLLVPDPDI